MSDVRDGVSVAQGPGPRPRSYFARLAGNTLAGALGTGLGSLVSLFTFIIITRSLGPEAFGNFTTGAVFLFIPVVLADLGISAVVLREISETPERAEQIMRASVSLRLAVSLAAVALSLGVGLALPFNDQATQAILIGGVGAFLTLMNLALLPALQADLRLHWAAAATIVGRVATLALTLGAVGLGLGFAGIVWAASLGLAFTFVVDLYAVTRVISLRPLLDSALWRQLLRASLVLGLALGLSQVYFRLDAVLLALLRDPEEVGLYGAAFRLLEVSEITTAAISATAYPAIARLLGKRDGRLGEFVQKTTEVGAVVGVALVVLLVGFATPIIQLTSGPQFDGSVLALRLLAPAILLSLLAVALESLLIATRQDRRLLRVYLVLLAANVILNLAFVPVFGYLAAAVVTVATALLGAAQVMYLAHREHGLRLNARYLPVVAAAAAVMVLVVLVAPGPPVVVAGLSLLAYAAVVAAAPGVGRETLLRLGGDRLRRALTRRSR